MYSTSVREGKLAVFAVFYLTVNLFPQIIALSISNTSLHNCYSKSLPQMAIFHSKHKSFPRGCFPVYGKYFVKKLWLFEDESEDDSRSTVSDCAT